MDAVEERKDLAGRQIILCVGPTEHDDWEGSRPPPERLAASFEFQRQKVGRPGDRTRPLEILEAGELDDVGRRVRYGVDDRQQFLYVALLDRQLAEMLVAPLRIDVHEEVVEGKNKATLYQERGVNIAGHVKSYNEVQPLKKQ